MKDGYIVQIGTPVDLITRPANEYAHIMHTDFPTVADNIYLENIFHRFQSGLPLVVTNNAAQFQGVIEAADLLISLTDKHANGRVHDQDIVNIDSVGKTTENVN